MPKADHPGAVDYFVRSYWRRIGFDTRSEAAPDRVKSAERAFHPVTGNIIKERHSSFLGAAEAAHLTASCHSR